MDHSTRVARARACYTDPAACVARIARAGSLAARIEEAHRLLAIARAPGFRFGLQPEDTAPVVPAIELELAALAAQARPIASAVLQMRAHGHASDEIGRALDLMPGEATTIVRFCGR